jgi:hypothetical protein
VLCPLREGEYMFTSTSYFVIICTYHFTFYSFLYYQYIYVRIEIFTAHFTVSIVPQFPDFFLWPLRNTAWPPLRITGLDNRMPITVAARSKAWTVFDHSNAGIVGSNPTQGMDVCMRLFCICVFLCVDSGFATGWSPVQGVLQSVYRINKLKKRPKSNKRTAEP